jgi:hypothetical protein
MAKKIKEVQVIHSAFGDTPRIVARVLIPDNCQRLGDIKNVHEALEYAWYWTNNIDNNWSDTQREKHNKNVIVVQPTEVNMDTGKIIGLRSTSVDDEMVVIYEEEEEEKYKVAPVGFEEVTNVSYK